MRIRGDLLGLILIAWAVAILPATGCRLEEVGSSGQVKPYGSSIYVACASSLAMVIPELAGEYEALTGTRVDVSFASSGSIAAQIRSGAPIDVFCSADRKWIDMLVESSALDSTSVVEYAVGRLVLAAADHLHTTPSCLEDLAKDEIQSVCMANPSLAPYGMGAQAALESSGVFDQVAGKIVLAENVSQAAVYVERGSVDCAFLPLALVSGRNLRFLIVDRALYSPIEHYLGIPRSSKKRNAAERFVRFLLGDQGREILLRGGFGVPGED